jgi:methylmalonyl-CoA mutase
VSDVTRPTTIAEWRAQVEAELAGAPFDKLVQVTAEGLALQPLYTEAVAPMAAARAAGGRFLIAMQVDPPALRRPGALAEDTGGGADALWVDNTDREALAAAAERGLPVIVEARNAPSATLIGTRDARRLVVANDPISEAAAGMYPKERLRQEVDEVARTIHRGSMSLGESTGVGTLPALPVGRGSSPVGSITGVRAARASGVAFHDAGADAADELALVVSAGVAYLRAFEANHIGVAAANDYLALQVAIGRDTFGELCKLRALRACWRRVLDAAGAGGAALPPIHAVCSARTAGQRDPWVNMLRVTTQVFAAALGGASWITPAAFDAALGVPSALGRRVARNTALVLREESQLGRVVDAAGGSYYVEARTDALAREAWRRFQAIERDGGVVALLASGRLRERLEAAWQARAVLIAKRKEPVLGVSEFANLDEQRPEVTPWPPQHTRELPRHRDAEGFEALRAQVERAPRDVVLVTLGSPAEHRARVGYASALFATAGVRVRETAAPEGASDVACLCGSDERYASEAAATARALRAAGARRVVLAGRPGALEPALREAGVGAFIYVGCDALATLTELLS